MIELLMAATLFTAPQDPAGELREPRQWGAPAWERRPIPDYPEGESGVVQALITCTAGDEGRLLDCRIDRVSPRRTRFGREVMRRLPGSRIQQGLIQPGDTTTFLIWACAGAQPCEPTAWPD